jgi:Fic family protein
MAMLSLQVEQLKALSVPVSTGWLLGECMEARGKQELWIRQRPEALAALREQAVIQSAESSNRIEGVTIASDRLRPVVLGKSKPRDRCEEELAGYRKALDWIFARKFRVAIEPKVMLHLHAMAQGGFSGDAGQWKKRDNEIIEFLPSGERTVRFKPTPAKDTPKAIGELCHNYQRVSDDPGVPPLLTVSTFILDFLCIHPFRDGNGRVSRLLTTLLLLQHGFEVGRYVSLERIVEDTKSDYYHVLGQCSKDWHDGKNQLVPWWNYFLGFVRRAYREFAVQVESKSRRPAKGELVRNAVLSQVGPFTLGDLRGQVPGVSVQQLKKVLGEMKKAGEVRLAGRGRGAKWEVAAISS